MVEVGPSTRKRQIALDTNQISAGFQQLMSLIDSTTLRDFIHLVTKSMTSPTGGPVGLVPTPDGKYRLILWPDVSNEEPDVVLLAEEIYRFERMPDKRVKGFEGWDFCTVGVEISRRLFSVEMTFGTLVEIPAVLTGHSVARKGVVIGYHTDLKDSRLKTELDLLVAPETPPD
jgi:hypothetical protein